MSRRKSCIFLVSAISLLLASPLGCTCTKIAELTPEAVVQKAYAATTEVNSFHFSISGTVTTAEGDLKGRIEGDFLSPDRMHMVVQHDGEKQEILCIGEKVYQRDSQTGQWRLQEGCAAQGALASMQALAGGAEPENIAEGLEGLEDIEELPDEVIDGVSCVHYRGRVDPLKSLREKLADETDPRQREGLQQLLEVQEQMETSIVAEVWIRKSDYLVRQSWVTQSQKVEETTMTITMVTRFSDFNEPVEIEAP